MSHPSGSSRAAVMPQAPGRRLPEFGAASPRDQAILDASRLVVALFVERRTSAFTVRELADHVGVSERTFYRYFPRKEDAVRPYLEAGLSHVVAGIRAGMAGMPLYDAIARAHDAVLDGAAASQTATLLSVLTGTERLRAVWLQVTLGAEQALAEVVAEAWDVPPDHVAARVAASAIVGAGRLALQQPPGGEQVPAQVFRACLTRMRSALEPPAREPA